MERAQGMMKFDEQQFDMDPLALNELKNPS